MKNKIITISFLVYIYVFLILHLILPDKEISNTERRKLKRPPEIKELAKNTYLENLDAYMLDHAPFRDNFRSLKAKFNYNILGKFDNNNIYLKDNYIFKSLYPTNKKSIANFINKTNGLIDLLKGNNTYFLLVPDKNYYLNSKTFLQIDYKYLNDELNKVNANRLNIFDLMKLDDYYETDTHWKQEKLEKVIKRISKEMKLDYKDIEYKKHTYDKFYGVYYGESAINRDSETITYLTNDIIDNAYVEYLENPDLHKVYNEDKKESLDAYEIYLDGASSYIEITNKKASNNKELIIVRDSFGSSITPLLIPYYKKITVIDNRYINSTYFKDKITKKDHDVLFIYSTLFVNESFTLKG